MTVTNQTGEARGIMQALRTAAITLSLMAAGGAASAANTLQDIRYAAAPGGKVDITLQFSGPVGPVQAFTTDAPPRIALDLPNTSNGLSARRVSVGSGATSSVSAAEAGGRTRVVVDLLRPAGYTTRSAGNLLVLTVDAGVAASANNAMANSADPIKRPPSNINLANVDFRRGDGGSGRLILRFDRDGAAADMRTEGDKIIIDVSNAALPENLRRHLDVTDFATPVASIDPEQQRRQHPPDRQDQRRLRQFGLPDWQRIRPRGFAQAQSGRDPGGGRGHHRGRREALHRQAGHV